MPEKSKRKNDTIEPHIEPLPPEIADAGYRYLSAGLVGGGVLLLLLSMIGLFPAGVPGGVLLLWPVGSLGAWLLGVRKRFFYVREHGSDAQQLRVRAEFWGSVSYVLSVVAALAVMGMALWYLLPFISSGPIAGLGTAIVAILFFIGAYWLAHQNQQRVYENFDYNPAEAIPQKFARQPDHARLDDTAQSDSPDSDTDAFVQALDNLDKNSNAN